jgi:TonB family protein
MSGVDYSRAESALRSAQRIKSGEPDRLLGLVRDRMNQGRLIEPDNDNAQYYMAQLRQQFPDQPGVGPMLDSLRAQLVERAGQAAGRKEAKLAQDYLDSAKSLGASGAAFDTASAAVVAAKRQADALATVLPVRDNMVVKSVSPEYPVKASRRKITGFVDVHFTVTTTGDVKDPEIVKAEPVEVFDDAALRAIRKWKFKPREIDGQLVEQRLGLRMRFELTD